MKKNINKALLVLAIIGLSNVDIDQCDSIAKLCSKHIIEQPHST